MDQKKIRLWRVEKKKKKSSEHFGTLSDGGCDDCRADAALDQNGTEYVFILGHARRGRSHEAGPRTATDRSGRTWNCHCKMCGWFRFRTPVKKRKRNINNGEEKTKQKQQNDHIINENYVIYIERIISAERTSNRKQISLLIRTQDVTTSMIIHQ